MTKRRGRPKGSKNRVYEHVQSVVIPARCRSCGSTVMKSIPGAKTRENTFHGVTKQGFEFVRTTWVRRQCAKCNAVAVVMTRFGPENNNIPVVSSRTTT